MSNEIEELRLAVTINNQPYKGWTCSYVGMGVMRFVHPDHAEFAVREKFHCDPNWMNYCFDEFLKHIESIEEPKQ